MSDIRRETGLRMRMWRRMYLAAGPLSATRMHAVMSDCAAWDASGTLVVDVPGTLLARIAGLAVRTAERQISTLREAGWIAIARRAAPGRWTMYELGLPEWIDPELAWAAAVAPWPGMWSDIIDRSPAKYGGCRPLVRHDVRHIRAPTPNRYVGICRGETPAADGGRPPDDELDVARREAIIERARASAGCRPREQDRAASDLEGERARQLAALGERQAGGGEAPQ